MLLLNDIEPEVLALILEFVDDVSPRTTKAIACVNKYFNEMSKMIAHRHKVIQFYGVFDDDIHNIIESWTSNQQILANIRTLTVKGYYHVDVEIEDEFDEDDDLSDVSEAEEERPSEEEVWKPVITLLSKIGRLRHLDWNIERAIPVPVFDAFEQYQRASTLRIFKFARASKAEEEPEPIELRLAKSPALTHLRFVWNYKGWPDFHDLAFRNITSTAPNLEYAGFINRIDVPMTSDQRRAPSEVKDAFRKNTKPNPSVKQLTLDGVEISKATLRKWSSTIDLNSLENIKFSRGLPTLSYFQSAAAMLPNLKHLSLNLRTVTALPDDQDKAELIAAIQNYITTCSPLQTLSIWSWKTVLTLSDILQRHGPTLRSLQLHERETQEEKLREVLSVDDVEAIRGQCPHLQNLTFDLNRSSARLNWDRDRNRLYYDELAKFPHLNTLQIYFDVGAYYIINTPIRYTPRGPIGIYDYDANSDSEADEGDGDDDNDDDQAATDITPTSVPMTSNPYSPSTYNLNPPPFIPSSLPSASASTSITASTSTTTANPPPAKRPRLSPSQSQSTSTKPNKGTRASRDTAIETYATKIWTTVFGGRAGARHLDVKMGEWESGAGLSLEQQCKRHLIVRPHERDDVPEPVVRVLRKGR